MLRDALTISALIAVVLLVRAIFKSRVPKRMVYALWLVVLLKLCLPGTAVSLPLLPAEEATAPVQQVEAETPVHATPAVQQPAQTVTLPQAPAQTITQTQPQETAKPVRAPLVTAPVLLVWFGGSVLLGLWLLVTWLVFTVRLYKDRQLLGRRGQTRIYVSGSMKSPCLAGLIPAVYLTADVPQSDAAELIVQHELTHLRHLDPLWSLCRTAAVIVYWWNPFIWLAVIVSKRDAELACDEAVAAKLSSEQRLAYARAILAQAPRKAAALSLAGPPVRERIVFLSKKQRTSVLCVLLALLLTVTAAGCSFTRLTAKHEDPEAAHQEALKSVLKTDISLTQEQIDAVNAAFTYDTSGKDKTLGHFAVNGFFTSTYADVRELNLKEFLAYFGECGEEDISEEEFAQLKDKWDDFKAERLEDFPLPIHRYPASAVEGVLRRFAGIGLADLKDMQEPFSGYTYLESTDAFYNTTSDYNPGDFTCTYGSLDAFGEYVQLYGRSTRFPGEVMLRLEKDGDNWYIKSFTLEIPADALPVEDPIPTTEPGYPLGLLLTQETAMRKDAADTAVLCDCWPLQEGEYAQALTERTVDGELWYLVECTPFDTPADTRGWVRADVTAPYTVQNMWDCTAPLYLVDGAQYYDGTGEHTLTGADPRGPYRITSYDETNYRYHLSGTGGAEIEIGGLDMVQFPALPADDPETISYQVQQKLAYARWNQTMTEDYEDQIRSFEAADYRDGWGVGQYPHYYKALADFFVSTPDQRGFLAEDAVWTRDMMADGLIMRVNMTQDEGGMSLYYSVVTHDLCVAPDELLGDENEAVLSAAEWFRTNVSENNDGRNLYAMLLTSSYRDPREIDLSKLFYNGLYDASNVITEEERTAVSQENPLADHLDIIKITRTQMDEALQKLTGLTLKETDQVGLDQFVYLKDFDAYYLVHSDAIDPRCRMLSASRNADGSVNLICKRDTGSTAVLLLRTITGWQITANELFPE